ncbi:hypothetical protein L2E82_36055 [Cichorium intybus]|uniref:Uncharacterized protein n=1 Tax=Cichorium intybus TaxID=13427 RepID=A0ACB9BQR7_CICIN|nr:hypothetical protein L2E82_36055 [Cichorium intybus]
MAGVSPGRIPSLDPEFNNQIHEFSALDSQDSGKEVEAGLVRVAASHGQIDGDVVITPDMSGINDRNATEWVEGMVEDGTSHEGSENDDEETDGNIAVAEYTNRRYDTSKGSDGDDCGIHGGKEHTGQRYVTPASIPDVEFPVDEHLIACTPDGHSNYLHQHASCCSMVIGKEKEATVYSPCTFTIGTEGAVTGCISTVGKEGQHANVIAGLTLDSHETASTGLLENADHLQKKMAQFLNSFRIS